MLGITVYVVGIPPTGRQMVRRTQSLYDDLKTIREGFQDVLHELSDPDPAFVPHIEYRWISPPHVLAALLLLNAAWLWREGRRRKTPLVESRLAVWTCRLVGAASLAGLAYTLVHMVKIHARHGGRGDTVRHADTLITQGLYYFNQHPYYVLLPPLLWWGLALLTNSYTPLISGTICCAYLFLVAVPTEERFLMKKFGEKWHDYATVTPRFGLRVLHDPNVYNRWGL